MTRRMQTLASNPPQHRAGIYILWNTISGKGYVGISQNMYKRVRGHERGQHGRKLGRAVAKYGTDAFLAIPLYYSLVDTAHLVAVESDLIKTWGTDGEGGYNVIVDGYGVGPYGPEFRDQKRRWAQTETGRETLARATRAAHTPEAKARRSATIRAWIGTPDGKEKMARLHSPDVRERMRQSLYRRAQTPEGIRQQRAASVAAQRPEARLKGHVTRFLQNACVILLTEHPEWLVEAVTPLIARLTLAGIEIPGVEVREVATTRFRR